MTNLLKRLAGWVALLFVVTTGTSNAQVSEKKVLTLEGARKVIAAVDEAMTNIIRHAYGDISRLIRSKTGFWREIS